MGGKSKSSQETTNTQLTTNNVNDGQYAGASGISIDESDTDIDNSVETDIEIDIDNSQEWDIDEDYDYSQDNDVNDSNNTDNSIENDGEFAGNNGTINFIDAGALEAATTIASESIEGMVDIADISAETNQAALEANQKITSDAFDFGDRAFGFGESALDEMQTVATSAMDNVTDFGTEAIDTLALFGGEALASVTEQAENFSDNLAGVTRANISSNQNVLENYSKSNTEDKGIIADLARSTSLAGQDIVAKTSEKMTMYMAAAMAIGFIALLFMGRK
jgi:hypothetical protein